MSHLSAKQSLERVATDSTQMRAIADSQESIGRVACGTVIAERHEVRELLGSGGMGVVYGAHDRIRNEDIAIKVLNSQLLENASATERFLAEAKMSCKLSHPNIVRVHDVGSWGGHYYFTMERLRGRSLRQVIVDLNREQRRLPVADVVRIAAQLIDALSYAHSLIVHRDLKPENIWVQADGTVKLMDFGIARMAMQADMTLTGMTLGTANYMAPEQRANAKKVDWRADQYALGITLYELLIGTVPMGSALPPRALRSDVPRRMSNAIMRAMAPRPEHRFAALSELLSMLGKSAAGPGRIATWIGIAAGASLVVWLSAEYNRSPPVIAPRVKTIAMPIASDASISKPSADNSSALRAATTQAAPPLAKSELSMTGASIADVARTAASVAADKSNANRMQTLEAANLRTVAPRVGDADALSQLQLAAQQGDSAAQVRLAWMYENGMGVPQDTAAAIDWYKQAALQGNQTAVDALMRLIPRRAVARDGAQRPNMLQRAPDTQNQPLQPQGPRNSPRSGMQPRQRPLPPR